MNTDKQAIMDNIIDLLTKFDEMGFQPTTTVPNPEAYAIKWRDELTKALIDYRKQSEWISVEERLPNKADWYLVYAENQRPFVAYFKGKTFPLNNHYHKITHWMPLPEPPKMKGGAE